MKKLKEPKGVIPDRQLNSIILIVMSLLSMIPFIATAVTTESDSAWVMFGAMAGSGLLAWVLFKFVYPKIKQS